MIKAAESVLGQGGTIKGHLGGQPAESSLGPRHWLKSKGG